MKTFSFFVRFFFCFVKFFFCRMFPKIKVNETKPTINSHCIKQRWDNFFKRKETIHFGYRIGFFFLFVAKVKWNILLVICMCICFLFVKNLHSLYRSENIILHLTSAIKKPKKKRKKQSKLKVQNCSDCIIGQHIHESRAH